MFEEIELKLDGKSQVEEVVVQRLFTRVNLFSGLVKVVLLVHHAALAGVEHFLPAEENAPPPNDLLQHIGDFALAFKLGPRQRIFLGRLGLRQLLRGECLAGAVLAEGAYLGLAQGLLLPE